VHEKRKSGILAAVRKGEPQKEENDSSPRARGGERITPATGKRIFKIRTLREKVERRIKTRRQEKSSFLKVGPLS